MQATDWLVLVWTVGTGLGTLVMVVLVQYVYQDREAVRAVYQDPTAVRAMPSASSEAVRMMADGEVTDQLARLVAVGSLFLAGVFAMRQSGAGLVEFCLIVSAAMQIFLGTIKLQRRRRIFNSIRTDRRSKTGGNHDNT